MQCWKTVGGGSSCWRGWKDMIPLDLHRWCMNDTTTKGLNNGVYTHLRVAEDIDPGDRNKTWKEQDIIGTLVPRMTNRACNGYQIILMDNRFDKAIWQEAEPWKWVGRCNPNEKKDQEQSDEPPNLPLHKWRTQMNSVCVQLEALSNLQSKGRIQERRKTRENEIMNGRWKSWAAEAKENIDHEIEHTYPCQIFIPTCLHVAHSQPPSMINEMTIHHKAIDWKISSMEKGRISKLQCKKQVGFSTVLSTVGLWDWHNWIVVMALGSSGCLQKRRVREYLTLTVIGWLNNQPWKRRILRFLTWNNRHTVGRIILEVRDETRSARLQWLKVLRASEYYSGSDGSNRTYDLSL